MPYQIFEGFFESFKEASGDLSFYNSTFYLEKIESKIKEQINCQEPVYEYIFTPIIWGLLSKQNDNDKLSILDYGGGAGISYTVLEKSIEDMSAIEYSVYDSFENIQLAKKYLSGKKNLRLFSELNSLNFNYDLLHLGSVIQYIEDLRLEFSQLFKVNDQKKPQFILLSDTYVGSNKTFVTTADYYGHKHPCKFRSWTDLLADLSSLNYKLKAKIPFIPQINNHLNFYDMSNLPEELRIMHTWHLFFELDKE